MVKYKFGILILFLLCLCSVTFVNAKENSNVLNEKIIYLDPGHGGIG